MKTVRLTALEADAVLRALRSALMGEISGGPFDCDDYKGFDEWGRRTRNMIAAAERVVEKLEGHGTTKSTRSKRPKIASHTTTMKPMAIPSTTTRFS